MTSMRLSLAFVLASLSLAACQRSDPQPPVTKGQPPEEISFSDGFDLSSHERADLEQRSAAGDAEASFAIYQFYSFAGGDGDPNVDDAHDRSEKIRWLEKAADQGHRTAQFNLAVEIAATDCPRGRRMMEVIAKSEPENHGARSWLKDRRFAC